MMAIALQPVISRARTNKLLKLDHNLSKFHVPDCRQRVVIKKLADKSANFEKDGHAQKWLERKISRKVG